MSRLVKMTIVHVVNQLDVGGMEKLLVEFARHTNRNEFNLHFISFGSRGILADDIEACGWPVTSLGVTPGLDPWLIVKLARTFRRVRADVVHTHNTKPLLYAGPAARLARIKRVIHTRHGTRHGAPTKTTSAFRIAARSADRIVCVSHDSARIAREEGLSQRRIRVLHNGIDLTRFRPATPEGDGPVVSVGRLSYEKDFSTLLRAAAIVARLDPTFRLEVAGGGSCEAELRMLVADLRLGDTVRLLGQVTDIPTLMSRGSIFTLSSLTEGISLTLLEAMAAGLPIVATRVGGNPEVVEDGRTGLLVPPADPDALAEALLALWRDPARRRRMGDDGRARVEAHFDIREMVASYEAMYLENQMRTGGRRDVPSPTAVR